MAEFQLNQLGTVAIAFVFVAIVIGIGADVLGDIRAGQGGLYCGTNSSGGTSGTLVYSGCGYDYNATGRGLESVDELGTWLPTIALVIAAAFVIGVLAYFRQ